MKKQEDIERESVLSDQVSEVSERLSNVESNEKIHSVEEAGSSSSDEDVLL